MLDRVIIPGMVGIIVGTLLLSWYIIKYRVLGRINR